MTGTTKTRYTVHPFGDEWLWDAEDDSRPMVEFTTEEAVILAVEERARIAAIPGVGPELSEVYWASIIQWSGDPDDEDSRSAEVGYVDAHGTFRTGSPTVDSQGHLAAEQHGQKRKLTVTYDVSGLTQEQIDMLAMEVVVQAEESEHHPSVPQPEVVVTGGTGPQLSPVEQ